GEDELFGGIARVLLSVLVLRQREAVLQHHLDGDHLGEVARIDNGPEAPTGRLEPEAAAVRERALAEDLDGARVFEDDRRQVELHLVVAVADLRLPAADDVGLDLRLLAEVRADLADRTLEVVR